MPISEADYCKSVCGGKCCFLYKQRPIRCPQLKEDCSCSIYKERFKDGSPALVQVGRYRFKGEMKNFYCGKMEYILKAGLMPEEMRKQCCIARPELLSEDYPQLLEKDYGTESGV